jgi:hypothetical protein
MPKRQARRIWQVRECGVVAVGAAAASPGCALRSPLPTWPPMFEEVPCHQSEPALPPAAQIKAPETSNLLLPSYWGNAVSVCIWATPDSDVITGGRADAEQRAWPHEARSQAAGAAGPAKSVRGCASCIMRGCQLVLLI